MKKTTIFKLGSVRKRAFGLSLSFPSCDHFEFNGSVCFFALDSGEVTIENKNRRFIGRIDNNGKHATFPFIGQVKGSDFMLCFKKRFLGAGLSITMADGDGNAKRIECVNIFQLHRCIFNSIEYFANKTNREVSITMEDGLGDKEIIIGCILCNYFNDYSNPTGSN